jgi:hypothetical protein
MHLYWRVIEELKFLGESWTFNDPTLLRHYEWWIKKNAESIALSLQEDTLSFSPSFRYGKIYPSLN